MLLVLDKRRSEGIVRLLKLNCSNNSNMRAGDDKSKKKKDSREKNNYVIKVKHNTNHDD